MRKKAELTLEEALENLLAIIDLEVSAGSAIGIVEDKKLVIKESGFSKDTILWVAPDSLDLILDLFKLSLKTVFSFLKEIAVSTSVDFSDDTTLKGIEEIMGIVQEASHHMDEYLKILEIKDPFRKILESLEYKQLTHFYMEEIKPKFSKALEGKEEWQELFEESNDALALDLEKSSLHDQEGLKKDQEYELFYLLDDQNQPFFTEDELRNMRLFFDVDEEALGYEEDPLLEIRRIKDRDLMSFAKQILMFAKPSIDQFYHAKIPLYKHELAECIRKMLLALMLSANPKNLMQATSHKNCLEYFRDFHDLLRKALSSLEYQNYLAYPEKAKGEREKLMLDLMQKIAKAFFFRKEGIKEEMIGIIYRLIHKADEKKETKSLWNELLAMDDAIRNTLKKFPSGPLGKDLDILRLPREEIFFDPIYQENLPHELYSIVLKEKNIIAIHLPAPVHQRMISSIKIIHEFIAFLESIKKDKQKHLLIQLDNRSSFKEKARIQSLEKLSQHAEYRESFKTITLPKKDAFYFQSEEFLLLSDATLFLDKLKWELTSENPLLFYPNELKNKAFFDWITSLCDTLFDHLFSKKAKLSRKERQDFIELIYHLIILHIIDLLKIDSFSFTCKDGLDIGGAFKGSFYAFYNLLHQKKFSKEDLDFLLYLFYADPLLVRERAIDSSYFIRALSFLSFFESILSEDLLAKLKKLLSF